jgi:hypothetical protein
MKMKKKSNVVAMALCLSVFAFFAMGSGSSSGGADKDISSVSTTTSSTKESTVESTSDSATEIAKDEANLSEITIEEQVLYDENDIKITAKGIEDGWLGTELKLLIENNSAKSITVQARNANVNGYMVDTMMSADVAAGKKANDSLTFETSGLKECGIENIATMEFYFYIFDAETWDEIVSTDVITVETSIADSYVQTYDDSGEVLVDTAGVKIIGKGLSVDDLFWGPGVILYIENNTDKDITVQVRDVSANGFMVDSTMSEDVVSGKKAMSAVQFYSSDLEENSIEDITDVELYFHIFDEDSWDTVFDSDVITISF